ncbi:uncharacterized protein BDZ99DRAFT_519083 [Mytilinidion resinicola]|uniref:Uncharacterized protein n=1 Tax=Mytilinidion resinicola TaxID=574789 RepID=A0A6A6YTI9_9PEZI|nr:uncharacterized protein BDZ99DRAFT_519083 [Mytilinidion resinicola]KAF2811839.1 hypothetical protein BDZ99DRAFT_519083 [Mytilinidion resinicola]
MTTRRAASNATNSRAGSVASANSPVQQPDAPVDDETERVAKRARLSTEPISPPNQIPSPASSGQQDAVASKPASRASSQASKTSRKRARNSEASDANGETNGINLEKNDSDQSEKRPAFARRQKRAKVASKETPVESTENAPVITDEASTASRSPEPSLENAITQPLKNEIPSASQEPVKVPKRLPGRRRQPHADVSIEADLRRQLQLKTAYRAIVKALKPVLGELAQRTLTGLEDDPEYHKQSDDYHLVAQELLRYKKQRIAVVDNKKRLAAEELERRKTAEEHIQREQFAIRFRILQEDLLLQCQHRLLQLEREHKGLDGTGTDDEDAVVVPRHGAQYPHKLTGLLPAKSESRSRVYIETEEMWKQAEVRFNLDKARKAFVSQNEDADDAIENLPGGFAAYAGLSGNDRELATASYNVDTLADAAMQLEQTAADQAEAEVNPIEEATALLLLADLSAQLPPAPGTPPNRNEPLKPAAAAPMTTPARKIIIPPASPFGPPSATSTAMSLETAESSPVMQPEQLPSSSRPTLFADVNGTPIPTVSQEAARDDAPAKSSNKITDLLNDDAEVSRSGLRGRMKPAAWTYVGVPTSNLVINGTYQVPTQTQAIDSHPAQLNGSLRGGDDRNVEPIPEQRYPQNPERKPAPYEPIRPREKSPPHGFWSNDTMSRRRNSRHLSPDRTPLTRIRQMLDSSRQQAPDRRAERGDNESTSQRPLSSSNTARPRDDFWSNFPRAESELRVKRSDSETASENSNSRRGSSDRTHMRPPPTRSESMTQPAATQPSNVDNGSAKPPIHWRFAHYNSPEPDKKAERAGSDSASQTVRRGSLDKTHMGPPPSRLSIPHERTASGSRLPSSGHNSAPSPSTGQFSFSQSPVDQQGHPGPHTRPNSTEQHGYRPPWEDGRRASAPQQHPPPISPYGPPPQGYPPDYNGQARAPPQSGPPLPPFVQTAQAPPPYNYRFAHYDSQGPPQNQYPTPVSGSYGPPPPQPPTHQSPYPPQQPPQHNPAYSGPPSFSMYQPHQPPQPYQSQPPPHHQQAPPPHQSPYPPLKYAGSQYGGQPILPANMDPRNSQSTPPQPYGQPPHLPAFSQQPPHKPQFEHTTGPGPQHGQPQEYQPKRRPRNYVGIAGSEFRTYTGPNQKRRP